MSLSAAGGQSKLVVPKSGTGEVALASHGCPARAPVSQVPPGRLSFGWVT